MSSCAVSQQAQAPQSAKRIHLATDDHHHHHKNHVTELSPGDNRNILGILSDLSLGSWTLTKAIHPSFTSFTLR